VPFSIDGRLAEEERDLVIRQGLRIFILIVASFFACIGLSNVFSATLGQLQQRKKEFARYFSLGVSEHGMKGILFFEVSLISLRPLVLSIAFNIPMVAWALNQAAVPVGDFLGKAPYLPVCLFTGIVFFTVGCAYAICWRSLFHDNIIAVLKDESLSY
jgi:putative ABC transport system permease protein